MADKIDCTLPHQTIYGYNIQHLELIARILQKENLPPERVAEALTDIGRIVAIVTNEFEESLRKAVENIDWRTELWIDGRMKCGDNRADLVNIVETWIKK